jgi:hypothetical protein
VYRKLNFLIFENILEYLILELIFTLSLVSFFKAKDKNKLFIGITKALSLKDINLVDTK